MLSIFFLPKLLSLRKIFPKFFFNLFILISVAEQSTKLPNPCLQFCFMKFIHEHTNKVLLDFNLIKINITDLAHLYGSFPLDNFREKKKYFCNRGYYLLGISKQFYHGEFYN